MKVIAPFPGVWTGTGRVLRAFFHNTMRIIAVTGRVLRLTKEETGPPGGSVAQQLFCIQGEVPHSSRPFRACTQAGIPTPKGKRAWEFSGLRGLKGVYMSR